MLVHVSAPDVPDDRAPITEDPPGIRRHTTHPPIPHDAVSGSRTPESVQPVHLAPSIPTPSREWPAGASSVAGTAWKRTLDARGAALGRAWALSTAGLAQVAARPAALHAIGALLLAALSLLGVARAAVFADEADNVLGACSMARGSLIYRDFFSHHFPLPYYALAATGESGACSVYAGRLLGGILLVLTGAAFAWITRSRLAAGAMLVVALAAPAYYLQLYLAETFVSAGLVLCLALLTERGRGLQGPPAHAIRFLALFILAWSSPIGLMMAGLLAPLLVLGARGGTWPVVVVGIAAGLTFPVILAIQGTLWLFVEQAILFNVQVYSGYLDVQLSSPPALLWETLSFVRHRFSFVVDAAAGQETKATVATFTAALELSLVALLAALAAVASGNRLFRLGACLVLPLAVARDGFHLAPFIPLASFACAYLLPTATVRPGLFRLAGLLVVVLALRVYFFHLPLERDAADELARSLQPDAQVTGLAAPSDTVLYLPIAPQGYLAQDRRPGSFHAFFLPWQADLPGAEDRVIADIEANKVAVIFMDQDTQIWGKYRLREYAPRLHQYVLTRYRPVDHRDPRRARVFARVDPAA